MSRFGSLVRAGVGWFEQFEKRLADLSGFILLFMAISIFYNVVARYVFNAPTLWADELNIIFILYFAFLGAAYTLITGGHVRVDVLFSRFSSRQKAIVDIVTFPLGVLFMGVLIWKGVEMSLFSLAVGKTKELGMHWPLFPMQIIIPIGSLFVLLQMILQVVRDFRFVFGNHSKPR